jgi:hypothetical protein
MLLVQRPKLLRITAGIFSILNLSTPFHTNHWSSTDMITRIAAALLALAMTTSGVSAAPSAASAWP